MLRRTVCNPAAFLRVVGSNSEIATRACDESIVQYNDLVGRHDQVMPGQRMDAGELLESVDICAAKTAMRHCYGLLLERSGGNAANAAGDGGGGHGSKPVTLDKSCATISMPSIKFRTSVMNGDYLAMTGTVVDAGSKSLAVHVAVDKLSWPLAPGECRRARVADCFTTFATIGKDLQAFRGVPPVGFTSDEQVLLHKQAALIKQQEQVRMEEERAIDKMSLKECLDLHEQLGQKLLRLSRTRPWRSQLAPSIYRPASKSGSSGGNCSGSGNGSGSGTDANSQIELTEDGNRRVKVPIKDATLEFHSLMFSSHLNLHQSVFGGYLMSKMERCALYTGRRFCCNRNVFTMGLSVNFAEPVLAADSLTIRCRPIHVRNSTVEVEVDVFVDRADGRVRTSNTATFVLVNLGSCGSPRPIASALDMQHATLEEHRSAAASLSRYARLAIERMNAGSDKNELA